MYKFKLGVVGAGFMATAIIEGAIKSNIVTPEQIIVCDINDLALEKISKIGVSTTKNSVDVITLSEFVLLAVKPQNLSSISVSGCAFDDKKIISIMAGVKKERIKAVFKGAKVVRCMPNTPCSIGFGAVGVDVSDFENAKDVQFVLGLLSSFATVVRVSEDKLNAVTGVSGSSPAYFYLFLKGIIDAGVKCGLDFEDAKMLAVSTMIGAGEMVKKNLDKSIDQLIDAVCSKGGTTIEAVKVYNENNLTEITQKAIDACVKRSKELENI